MTDIEQALLKWAENLNKEIIEYESLDSWIIYDLLKKINPNYFTILLIPKNVVVNCQLEASNLNIVIKDIIYYYYQVLNLEINISLIPKIDINNCKSTELKAMILQFVLGCAVNSETKQIYIENILKMDQSDQEALMKAITQLDIKEHRSFSSQFLDEDSFNKLKMEKEELENRCQEFSQKITSLNEEKDNLLAENRNLFREITLSSHEILLDKSSENERSEEPILGVPLSSSPSLSQIDSLRKQIDSLKSEIFTLENAKEDCQIQINLLNKDNFDLKRKNEQLTKLSSETLKNKDELDVLRHMAEKIPMYESTIENYKKKLETLSFSQPMDALNEKNSKGSNSLDAAVTRFEEERKKSSALKKELELLMLKYRESMQDHDRERDKLDKVTVQKIELQETVSKFETKIQNLSAVTKNLKEENDHLHLCLMNAKTSTESGGADEENKGRDTPNAASLIREGDGNDDENDFIEREKRYLSCLSKVQQALNIMEANNKIWECAIEENDALKKENASLKKSQETICTAWNNLALRMYKQNMKEHFNSNLWSHNSFLNRQRLILASKTMKK